MITQPQARILDLSVNGRLDRSDIIDCYKSKSYSKPEASTNNVVRKLIAHGAIKRTRIPGLYKLQQ